MRPDFYVSGLSEQANDCVLSINIDDQAGIKSDSCTITLDDRDYLLAVPPTGLIITVSLGYKETGLMNMGTYQIDEIKVKDSQASTMEIKAQAQYHKDNAIKSPRTQPWDEKTLGQIVGTLGSRNGYLVNVDPALAGIFYDHLDQCEESDTHLLSRLAERHDAYSKFQDGTLYFYPREQTLGTVTVERSRMKQWTKSGRAVTVGTEISATLNSRMEYKRVRAGWHNRESAQRVYEEVGTGEPMFDMRNTYESKEKAQLAAGAKFKQLARGTGQIDSLTVPGDPAIRAEMDLVLVNFRPEICGIKWVITQATHTLDNSGYRTVVKADTALGKNMK